MGKRLIPPEDGNVQEIALREALEERYLAYALSTIMHRALPDARDGLKPVHRRILYGMRLLRLDPGAAFKKSAKIVGDVMGNFHPHGDQAIYDALVRLAQDFASRYPLIDGQGNFGNIDGDNAAAYRYTEARMTEVARLLIEGIDEDAVDFRPNYDGLSEEPVVLPGAFPNLLANGSQGIAVGMATSIPPHNAAELCDAALYLITHKRTSSKALMQFVPGPDFPTGGIVVDDKAAIAEAYATGRGSFRVRARWNKEDQGRGVYSIVITEIPYLVQKSRLIEKIAELLNDRKLPLVADVRDESTEDVRLDHRAEIARGRRDAADGIAVQADRAGEPRSAQHERAGEGPRADRGRPRRSIARMARSPPRRPGAPLQASARRDRAPAGSARRLAGRVSQPRQGDQDHPHRGRAQARPDEDLQDHRRAGRRHPQHAAAQFAQARGNGDPRARTRSCARSARSSKACSAPKPINGRRSPPRSRKSANCSGRKRNSANAARVSREAPEHDAAAIEEALVEREPITVVVSEKGWIRALRGHVSDLSSASRSRRTTR